MTTRRTFLHLSSLATLAAVGRRPARSAPLVRRSAGTADGHFSGAPDLHILAMHALDAATAVGATYVDVRFTVTQRRSFSAAHPLHPENSVIHAVGIRALAHGAWGFAAATQLTPDVIVRAARLAAEEAKATAWPNLSPIDLGERPPIATGHWQTPVQRDPFTVPVEEFDGLVQALEAKAAELDARGKGMKGFFLELIFERQERTFASTDGAFVTQTISTALGGRPHAGAIHSALLIGGVGRSGKKYEYLVPAVAPTGGGYEVVAALGLVEHLPEWLAIATAQADAKPFEAIGEYDVVFDANAMAQIVDATCGDALAYDTAVGDTGNSYLGPPATILGTRLAPSSVTITADRTLPGGAGTVGWDDEGIAPRPVPLVKDGIVVNYATTREYATELTGEAASLPVGRGPSNGCAASESALTLPLVHTPNLILHPGEASASFDALLRGISHGYAICGGTVTMDQQLLTGQGEDAQVYQVRNGKLGLPVAGAQYTFQSRELWRNLVALGGSETAVTRGLYSSKGAPNQVAMHTVSAVAAHVQRVRLQLHL